MGGIYRLSRVNALAQQGRWQPAASTHLSAHDRVAAAVVPRWEATRILRAGARPECKVAHDFGRWRNTDRTTPAEPGKQARCRLVLRRHKDRFRQCACQS